MKETFLDLIRGRSYLAMVLGFFSVVGYGLVRLTDLLHSLQGGM